MDQVTQQNAADLVESVEVLTLMQDRWHSPVTPRMAPPMARSAAQRTPKAPAKAKRSLAAPTEARQTFPAGTDGDKKWAPFKFKSWDRRRLRCKALAFVPALGAPSARPAVDF